MLRKFENNSYILTLTGGALLCFAWPVNGFAFLIFAGFVPFFKNLILCIEHKKPLKLFVSNYIGFLVWNLGTTWWIAYASFGGAMLAWLANSMLMSLVFQIAYSFGRNKSANYALFFVWFLWMAFEYLHLQWELTWPWLNLGNVFAEFYYFIQWYEFTGTAGGTFWILAANFMLYLILNSAKNRKKNSLIFLSFVLLPCLISFLWYTQIEDKGEKEYVQIIQPNIDPYKDKFGNLTVEQQIERMLKLAEGEKSAVKPALIVLPETAIPYNIWIDELENTEQIVTLKKFCEKNKVSILTGATTAKYYETEKPPTSSARKLRNQYGYYDSFNSALNIYYNSKTEIYHKSKLVPGVEKIPYPFLMKPFEQYAIDLGGTIGSLGTQNEREVFKIRKSKIIAAPVICYESVYGSYCSDYIRKGGNLICIVTNDGWWEDTPGYKQHLSYARIRAIENRRSIARSANTGISAFINQRGDILFKSEWWTETAKTQSVYLNNDITFYAKTGDYFSIIAMFGIGFMLVFRKRIY